MKMQHVNVKLLLGSPEAVRLEPLVPIFHEWIEHKAMEELLLDIADYSHVPQGPGIVLIGHQADYSVDNTLGRLGVRYNRKAEIDGHNQDSMAQAARAALAACKRLEEEPRLDGNLRFGGHEIDLFINDRLIAPNTEATRHEAREEFETFFGKLFAGGDFSLTFDTDPRRLFRLTAKTTRAFSSADLIKNLAS